MATRSASLQHLALVLRTTLVKRVQDYDCFDKIFQQYWHGQLFTGPSLTTSVGQLNKKLDESVLVTKPDGIQHAREAVETMASFYSPFENLATKRFVILDAQRGLIVQRNVRLLARLLAMKEGVRYRRATRGQLDLRATIRRSLETHGELLHVTHRERKRTNGPVVVFCDVSGSMDSRSQDLLTIIHAIQNAQPRAETFIFSTELLRVTRWLLASSLDEAARQISARAHVWGSGTKIGYCLSTALTDYTNILTRDTLVVIISDGWDVGDLELLRKTMEELRRRVGVLVWLNPWADEPNFELGSSGLKTALPYVDLHAGSSILYDRQRLLRSSALLASKLSSLPRLSNSLQHSD